MYKMFFKIIFGLLLFLNTILLCSANNFTNFIKETFDPIYAFEQQEKSIFKNSTIQVEKRFNDLYNLDNLDLSFIELEPNEDFPNNFADLMKHDENIIQSEFKNWQKNKNNMSENKDLILYLQDEFDNSREITLALNKIYEDEYIKYLKQLYTSTKNLNLISCKESHVKDFSCYPLYNNLNYKKDIEEFKSSIKNIKPTKEQEISKILDDYSIIFQDIIRQITDYSIKYETKKLNNFYKNKYGNINNCGEIQNLTLGGESAQNRCYYDAKFILVVIQVIPGGVLVRDEYGGINSKQIFIETNKKYVDKETLTGRYLYTGIFKYTNLLGLTKTVWKFKEIPIPSEDFYFISK